MSFKSLTSVFKRNYIPVSSYVPQKGFRPHVFVEFKIDNNDAGRVVFEVKILLRHFVNLCIIALW